MSTENNNLDLSTDNLSTEDELTVDDVLESPENKRTGWEGYESYVEVERYWVLRPYVYISLIYNERDQNYIYYAVEPAMDDYEKLLLDEVSDRLRDRLMTEEVEGDEQELKSTFQKREHVLLDEAIEVARDYGVGYDENTLHKVLYYIERDFIRYGKIEPIMQDPRIEDISCDGVQVPVFVYHRQREDIESNIQFGKQELNNFVIRLAQRSGKHVSAADPLVDASLPDGSRAQLTLGSDVSTRGSTFTIRKFRDEPLTPVQLINFGTFSLEEMSYLWFAIENDRSLIFAGGTGSGKTTSMNAVSLFIPPRQKVVSIEDTREITLPHENWVPLVTRGSFGAAGGDGEGADAAGEVTMFKLLRSALRARPEYLLVGEVRGPEAKTLFQAMSTGHTTYSTFHADDVESVFQRFRNEPINVPEQMLRALDIISIQEETRVKGERERRNRVIAEVGSLSEEGGGVNYENHFTWDADADQHMEARGMSTVISEIAQENGLTLDEAEQKRREREQVLEYLLENEIFEYEDVTRIIQAFMIDKERVLGEIEDDSLEPENYEAMESLKV